LLVFALDVDGILFGSSARGHGLPRKTVIARAVILLSQVAKLMADAAINTLAWTYG
jgi:hypothetical protein